MTSSSSPIQAIILDAGPILKNDPPAPTLLSQAQTIYTVPSVIDEIKDQTARTRYQTILAPFVTLRQPNPVSFQFVASFAKKSGDYGVLSRTDLEVLALTYELHCDIASREGLREFPGQKVSKVSGKEGDVLTRSGNATAEIESVEREGPESTTNVDDTVTKQDETCAIEPTVTDPSPIKESEVPISSDATQNLTPTLDRLNIDAPTAATPSTDEKSLQETAPPVEQDESSDSEGWITPSNLQKHLAADEKANLGADTTPTQVLVACITTDFACQNVLLQIGLHLLSANFIRVRHIKTFILRCHACFNQVKDTTKQFCPRCGQPTLTRVTCSTDNKGVFRIHLKKNMAWTHRGDRYSIPKPVHGSAAQKAAHVKGGGQGGWGSGLILSEDQKEYQRAKGDMNRGLKARDIMDEDYLPSILTGERHRSGGKVRVGAGKNVNSRRRMG